VDIRRASTALIWANIIVANARIQRQNIVIHFAYVWFLVAAIPSKPQ
jgi:hypothetical protein